MRRLVIANVDQTADSFKAALIEEDGRAIAFYPFTGQDSLTGRIYAGTVENIAKGIEAAFVRFGDGLKGYLPVSDNPAIKPGRTFLVQVSSDAAKGKLPRLTTCLCLNGDYLVLSTDSRKTGVSKKLPEKSREALKETIKELTEAYPDGFPYGVVVRTCAVSAAKDQLALELDGLKKRMDQVKAQGAMRTPGSLMYCPPHDMERIAAEFINSPQPDKEIIVEDQTDYERCMACLEGRPEPCPLRLYTDPLLPLGALYRFRTTLEAVMSPRVWLKSGAFLMIEQTEAFVSIDVNTGKCVIGSERRRTFNKINREAALEIARQLRLRNLSGMILIDFINMEEEEDRQSLMRELSQACSQDSVHCEVVDMTKLGIVEVTRRKVHPSVRESLGFILKKT